MRLIVREPPKPPLWDAFISVTQNGPGPPWFGFPYDWALIHRFNARYRLAQVCTGLKTYGYGGTTARGYDALTRTFLCWSLFELYLKLVSIKGAPAVAALLDARGAQKLLDQIKAIPAYERFFGAIEENLDLAKHQASVAKFRAGKPCDPGLVLASVRHVFAHGFLTPNAGGIEPMDAVTICELMSTFLLQLVDAEWRARVEIGLKNWEATHQQH